MASIHTKTAQRPPRSDDNAEQFRLLLEEIEKEEVPERLLELARQLQTALTAKRNAGDNPTT